MRPDAKRHNRPPIDREPEKAVIALLAILAGLTIFAFVETCYFEIGFSGSEAGILTPSFNRGYRIVQVAWRSSLWIGSPGPPPNRKFLRDCEAVGSFLRQARLS